MVQARVRTRTSLRATDFKSRDDGATYSYETIQASTYAPSGRQGIASAGLVSTRPATILAPSLDRRQLFARRGTLLRPMIRTFFSGERNSPRQIGISDRLLFVSDSSTRKQDSKP